MQYLKLYTNLGFPLKEVLDSKGGVKKLGAKRKTYLKKNIISRAKVSFMPRTKILNVRC